MDYSEFKQHGNKADVLARKNFSQYKLRLRLFAMLGYLVIIRMIFAVIATIDSLGALAYISPAILHLLMKNKLIFILIPML